MPLDDVNNSLMLNYKVMFISFHIVDTFWNLEIAMSKPVNIFISFCTILMQIFHSYYIYVKTGFKPNNGYNSFGND